MTPSIVAMSLSAPNKNMAFGCIGHFLLVAHNRNPPSEAEWDDFIELNSRHLATGPALRHLVSTEGGSPDTNQRRLLHADIDEYTQLNPRGFRSAVLTPSTFARGIVTAMSLVQPSFRAFAPDDLDVALRWLEASQAYLDDLRRMLDALRAEVSRPTSLLHAR